MEIKDTAYVNKLAIIGHVVLEIILLISYFVEFLKGDETFVYFSVVAAFAVVPVLAELMVYFKKKDAESIRHILAIGYAIFYLFVILTSDIFSTFVYVLPFFILLTIYSDLRYVITISVSGFLINVFWVIWRASHAGLTGVSVAEIEVRLGCLLVSGIFLCISTDAVKRINENKLKLVAEQQDKNQILVSHIVETSESMADSIHAASDKMETLAESMTKIHDSMEEVSRGSNETAQAVQTQLLRTEQIQDQITRVREATNGISENISNTALRVEEGQQHMQILSDRVDESIAANREMVSRMNTLSEYTNQMNTIIETITSIANSTVMLALNASIEAAHAGEAGRGFAVVAQQISSLASQTKNATVNITELIGHIHQELDSVSKAAQIVTESNKSNEANAKEVESNFTGISEGTNQIRSMTGELMEIIKTLEAANSDIVENIQTISAVTEEVSAHANETFESCEANSSLVDSVGEIVSDISDRASELHMAV